MLKSVVIFNSSDRKSVRTRKHLVDILDKHAIKITDKYEQGDLIICIGGDGTFLKTLRFTNYPQTPVLGINTGHLGFFQELAPDQLNGFIDLYREGHFNIQKYNAVVASVTSGGKERHFEGMNEIVIRGEKSTHLSISIGDSYLQKFSGDGILICPPAGSTAYNYSLGGSIVDPSLKVLQITPIAPINTSAYRSFTSSVIVPEGKSITVVPERVGGRTLLVITDGRIAKYNSVEKIVLSLSKNIINLVRLEGYDFWDKVKGKLLE